MTNAPARRNEHGGPAADPPELAPEREIADDGEPEREPERDRPRRARASQETGPEAGAAEVASVNSA